MDTRQIDAFGKRFFPELWLGCFAQDEPHLWHCRELSDKIKKGPNGQFLIINTDDLKYPGEHWVLVVFIGENKIYIFDSFGKKSIFKMLFDDVPEPKISNQFAYSSNDNEKEFKKCSVLLSNYYGKKQVNLRTFLQHCLNDTKDKIKISFFCNQIQNILYSPFY